MREWDAHSSDSDAPEKVAFVLEHQYCSGSLSFNGLKNVDRARANVLLSAQCKVKFDLYLTTMTWNHIQYASKKRFQNRSVSFGKTVITVPFVCSF